MRADPYPYYRYLREHAPVKFVPSLNAYAVSRHEDVRLLLLNHAGFSSDPLIKLAFGEFHPALAIQSSSCFDARPRTPKSPVLRLPKTPS